MEKDNLYRLFRRKFKNPSQEEMDWVQPDDMIFENVLNELSEEDDNKKPLFWMFGYGVLILLFISIPFLYSSLNGSGTNNLYADNEVAPTSISSEQENIQVLSNVVTEDIQNQLINNSVEPVVSKEQKIQESNPESAKLSTKLSSTSRADSKSSALFNDQLERSKTNLNTESGISKVSEVRNTEIVDNLIELPRIDVNKINQIIDLSFVPNDISLFSVNLTLPDAPQLSVIKEEPNNKKSRSIFLAAGYSSSVINHPTGRLSNDMLMTGHDEWRSGWNISFGYQKDLSDKWSLQTFASFNHITLESLTTCSVNYDSNNEYMHDGVTMYQTDLNLITPTTGFVDNVEFVIEDVAMNDNDMLTNNLNIKQDISLISTNVGISYQLLGSDRFTLDIGFAGGLDLIIRNQELMNVELMVDDHMLFEKDKEWVNHKGINRIGANIGFNLRANWKLSDQYSIFFSPTYRQSITSIRSEDLLEERSYFNIYQISTGVSYRF